jgi:uncharacterized membrane protein
MGAISTGDFEQAWLLNPIAFLACFVVVVWAFQITPLIKFAGKATSLFRSQSLSLQVMILLLAYVLVWIAAVVRFDSGIL